MASWLRHHAPTVLYLFSVVVFAIAFAVAFRNINDLTQRNSAQIRANCARSQRSWSSRRQTILVLTTPPAFPNESANANTHAFILELQAQRSTLLRGLGPRPICPKG